MFDLIEGGTTPHMDPFRYIRHADEARDDPEDRRTFVRAAKAAEQLAVRALREQMAARARGLPVVVSEPDEPPG